MGSLFHLYQTVDHMVCRLLKSFHLFRQLLHGQTSTFGRLGFHRSGPLQEGFKPDRNSLQSSTLPAIIVRSST